MAQTYVARVNGTRVYFTIGEHACAVPVAGTDFEQCEDCGAPIYGDNERSAANVWNGELVCSACGSKYRAALVSPAEG